MPDQTFYIKPGDLGFDAPSASSSHEPPGPDISFSFDDDKKSKLHRGLLCRCYAGRFWSITARDTEHIAANLEPSPPRLKRPDVSAYDWSELSKWPGDNDDPASAKHRAQNAKVIDLVWEFIIAGYGEPAGGLIVVSGSTGSLKSSYARELARRAVLSAVQEAKGKKVDRPHIVTYEDPIESWFAFSPDAASKAGFEYTPRQKGFDVDGLRDAVSDALRQKPALLYVGEVRSDGDWRAVLSFAGTGHLAITTTHAGSLAKTFEKILYAAKARTPADRSDVGSCIVAVMHVRKIGKERVPSLWVQTDRSRTALTQEGLSSLLPTGDEDGRYGRRHFADQLKLGTDVLQKAVMCDIRGD